MTGSQESPRVDETAIRLIAGLGNPGSEYAATRHNIGFMVVDQLVAQFGSSWKKSAKWEALSANCGAVLLVKPLSFMNHSGYPVFAVAQFYKIPPQQILVTLDRAATTASSQSSYNLEPKTSHVCELGLGPRRAKGQSITY
jgi:peptidyl-tRNA hydrolase